MDRIVSEEGLVGRTPSDATPLDSLGKRQVALDALTEADSPLSGSAGILMEPPPKNTAGIDQTSAVSAVAGSKGRKWGDMPHPVALMIMFSSTLIATLSGLTTVLNYQEARRNNLTPPLIGLSASLVLPPAGPEYGEFEFIVRNDGKTPAQAIRIRRGLGMAVRQVAGRGGAIDNEKVDAFSAARHRWTREELLSNASQLVETESWARGKPAIVDVLGPGQSAIVRIRGSVFPYPFKVLWDSGKAYLVLAGIVEYSEGDDGSPKRSTFCFERHSPFIAPDQKELLAQCSDDMEFYFQ